MLFEVTSKSAPCLTCLSASNPKPALEATSNADPAAPAIDPSKPLTFCTSLSTKLFVTFVPDALPIACPISKA